MNGTRQEPQIGQTYTAVPVGQKRRQTFVLHRLEGEYAVGLLVSRRYPGNYRGTCTVETADLQPVRSA